MSELKLSAPWEEYVSKIRALFEQDDEITFKYENMVLTIYVDNTDKYEALTHLLPEKKIFGNVALDIKVVPANDGVKDDRYYLKNLFKNNTAVTTITDISIGTNPMTFIEFEKRVVQYYVDNAADLHGNRTTVFEEIAREVFENKNGVYFCTDNEEPF